MTDETNKAPLSSSAGVSESICRSLWCPCLNVKIDVIDQQRMDAMNSNSDNDKTETLTRSKNKNETNILYDNSSNSNSMPHPSSSNEDNRDEWKELSIVLRDEESVDPQLYYKAFILSLHIKYKWLISVKHIDYKNKFFVLYKCCTCQTELFLSSNNIIGKSYISHKFQNIDESMQLVNNNERYFSNIFDIALNPRTIEKRNLNSLRIRIGHPLNALVEKLREDERVAKQYRIEEFTRQEEENFAQFCQKLEKDHKLLYQAAYQSEIENSRMNYVPNYLMTVIDDDTTSVVSESTVQHGFPFSLQSNHSDLMPTIDRSELEKQKYWQSADFIKETFESWNNDLNTIAQNIHQISTKNSTNMNEDNTTNNNNNDDNSNTNLKPNNNSNNNVTKTGEMKEENEEIANFLLNSKDITDKPQLRNPIELDHNHELKIQMPLKKDGSMDVEYIRDMFITPDSQYAQNRSLHQSSLTASDRGVASPQLSGIKIDTLSAFSLNQSNSRPNSRPNSSKSNRSRSRKSRKSQKLNNNNNDVLVDVIDEELEMFDMDDDDEFMDEMNDYGGNTTDILDDIDDLDDVMMDQMDQMDQMDDDDFDTMHGGDDEDVDDVDDDDEDDDDDDDDPATAVSPDSKRSSATLPMIPELATNGHKLVDAPTSLSRDASYKSTQSQASVKVNHHIPNSIRNNSGNSNSVVVTTPNSDSYEFFVSGRERTNAMKKNSVQYKMEKIPVKSTSRQIAMPAKSLISRSLNPNSDYKFATSMEIHNETLPNTEPLTYQPPTEFMKQRMREELQKKQILNENYQSYTNHNGSMSGRNRHGFSVESNNGNLTLPKASLPKNWIKRTPKVMKDENAEMPRTPTNVHPLQEDDNSVTTKRDPKIYSNNGDKNTNNHNNNNNYNGNSNNGNNNNGNNSGNESDTNNNNNNNNMINNGDNEMKRENDNISKNENEFGSSFEPIHKQTDFDDVPSHLLAYSLHPTGNKHFI